MLGSPDRRAPHPWPVPRDIAAGVTSGIQAGAVYADPSIGRAGSDSLARERRLADHEALVFLLSTRNDVLRVSAYMQPRDRAWQIGSARVCCMCIAHRAHTYIGSSPSKVEDISRGVRSYLQRKWAFTTQPASNLKEYIYTYVYRTYIYFSLFTASERRFFEGG